MTNREWLNSLTDDDFVLFLTDSMPKKLDRFEYNWGLRSILIGYLQSQEGLRDWLKQEHFEQNS